MVETPDPEMPAERAPQRGVIIVWFALFMMTMLSFVALGVDVAKLAATRTQLQNAADAAALAGASAIDPETGKLVRALAVERAQDAGARNEAFIDQPRPVLVDASDIELLDDSRIKVTVRRQGGTSVVTTMAQVLGIHSLEAAASAVAQVDTAESICNVAPIGIIPPTATHTYQTGCGSTYIFKFGTLAGGDGNYRPLMLPPCYEGECGGMNPDSPVTFECLMKNGYHCCISIKEWIFLERQPWIGPLRAGIDDRFEQDTDKREGICFDDYHGNGSRILFVPITTPEVSGDSGVWVKSMAAFFVKTRLGAGASAALVGEFVHAIAPGTPGGHEGNGGVAYAIHLVR